jgi:hypothetical protein
MSAIEMMDPKMDAGMIGNQVNRKVLNFEQAIKVLTIVLKRKTSGISCFKMRLVMKLTGMHRCSF